MSKFGNFIKKVAPFGGRMLGADKDDKKKYAPREQYFGGGKEQEHAYRERYVKGSDAADALQKGALERSTTAADKAANDYDGLGGRAYASGARQEGLADQDRAAGNAALRDYTMGRGATLANAQALENSAATMRGDYQNTAQNQFRAQQDSNQRAAMSIGGTGGAGGLRTALASSTAGNQQAATNAQITQAQEMNQLLGMQNDARVNAANIRSGVGAQDQGQAGLLGQREQAARGNQLAYTGLEGNAIQGAYGTQYGAAGLQQNAATQQRGQYLQSQAALEGGKLNAAREYEQQRQQNEKANYTADWFPLKRFNSPA